MTNASGLMRGTPAYRRAVLALVLAGFATFSTLYSVQPLMPVLSRVFSVGAATASLALSATTGVLAVTLFVAGLLSGSLPRKPVMGVSILASAMLSFAAAMAPNWSVLISVRALDGLALGGVPALAIAYLSEEIHPADLGSAAGLYIAGTAVGGMGGRVIAGVIADVAGWRTALIALGAIGLVTAVGFMALLPASRHFQPQSGLRLREHMAPIGRHLRHPALPFVFAWGLLSMGVFVSVYNYVGYRLEAPPFNLGQSAIAAVFSVYIVGVFTSTAAGRLADQFGRVRILATGCVLMCIGVGIMAMPSVAAIVSGMALLTVGFFAGHATASGWIGRLAETGQGHAAGLYLLAYYIGSSAVGSAVGLFWYVGHWTGVTLALGVLMVVGVVVVIRLMYWQRQQMQKR
ncbi:MFS transporter [Salinisphaera sp. USBA-960]|uniref:MFS transporter n=1 Tax=Salinisphaera orenii TaxID=856731 RepID=UPI000DBE057A|nr:MFS transporter [Salifodinibacter halophilus]NNC25854.1 MFS transporter [Salifodinibacter halophilus]